MTAKEIQHLKEKYQEGLAKAKQFIIENLFWSEPTFYRKMKQQHKLTEQQNEVIENAYRQFLQEPLNQLFNQVNHQ